MRLTTLKWLRCYLLLLTIGTIRGHTAKEAFVRGLLIAGIVVNAAPAVAFGLDVVPMCNAITFVGSCAELSFYQWHPARAGVAVGTGSVLATIFVLDKLERHKKRQEELARKLRYSD